MKIRLRKSTGNFKQEKLPILIFFAGLAGLLALQFFATGSMELCLFRKVLGFECPSCGVTRAFMAALDGDLISALKWNPLMFVVTILALENMILQLVFRRTIALEGTRRERRVVFFGFLLLLLINWIYILNRG